MIIIITASGKLLVSLVGQRWLPAPGARGHPPQVPKVRQRRYDSMEYSTTG